MEFKLGLAVGFAAGYVLGTRAGHERYEQIERAARRAWESGQAQHLRAGLAEKVPMAMSVAKEKVAHLRHRDRDVIRGERLPA